MRNSFKSAVKNTSKAAYTENGALTYASSNDPCVDLFFLVGSSRKNPEAVLPVFNRAFAAEPETAIRILLWARDAREGAGERDVFRTIIKANLSDPYFSEYVSAILNKVPELGRWDDLYAVMNASNIDQISSMLVAALKAKDGLAAKWTPRQGEVAAKLRKHLGLTPKQWRKMLVKLSNTVEQKMCARDWSNINFSHVPSVAAKNYQKAFARNDEARYTDYRDKLVKAVVTGVKDPTVKVNAVVVYPHEIVRQLRGRSRGDAGMALAQWAALPDWVVDGDGILPVVDVSGSMETIVSGTTTRMDVSIGLGLYFADKQKGSFKDMVLTFSEDSSLQVLSGSITQKVKQLEELHWGMSTDLQSAFHSILSVAVRNRVPQSDMPKKILIISDMEFNACVRGTNLNGIRAQYAAAGYKLPHVVFWNVAGRVGNSPATAHSQDVALVSGFSPSIISAVMETKDDSFTPRGVMMKKIMKDRYKLPGFKD